MPTARVLACVLLAASAITMNGCQTLSEDFSDLVSGLNPPSATEAARMMFNQRDPDERRKGVVLLSNSDFGDAPPYVATYRDMVQYEQNPLALAAAIRALGRFGQPADALLIAVRLEHENDQVQWEAARALQRLHWPEVVPELLRALGDQERSVEVRVAAAEALGQYPEDRVFQGLVAALDARPLAVNVAAEQALRTITGRELGSVPEDWLAWYDGMPAGGDRDPFGGARDYYFPTYQRDRSWIEQLAFWSSPVREQPAQPAGLRTSDERSTYVEPGTVAGEDGEAPAP